MVDLLAERRRQLRERDRLKRREMRERTRAPRHKRVIPQAHGAITEAVMTLWVELRGYEPRIWRRVQVRGGTSFEDLHYVFQELFDWESTSHWLFFCGKFSVGDQAPDALRTKPSPPHLVALADVVKLGTRKLSYLYDYTDLWWVDVNVETIRSAQPARSYPRCLDGKRAGPPEAVGGVRGYKDLLRQFRSISEDDYERYYAARFGDEFDPEWFDPGGISERLAAL